MIQQTASQRPLNAFTVDVEDYYQVSGFEDVIPRLDWDDWDKHRSRIRANTYRFLEILDQHDVKATFFVLGWVAERHPQMVREIAAAGHEIGCHSYWHHLIYNMSIEDFREDLHRATAVIEDAIGEKVETYRAPCFSIVNGTRWALDELVEQGYKYDSSIFPVSRSRCGIADANRFPHQYDTESGSILEFPLTVYPVGKRRVPVGGGGYFRLFPVALSKYFLKRINERQRKPFVFYIHPWEIDVDQPRIANGNWRAKKRHYLNLSKTERRLRHLLTEFRFGTLRDSFAAINMSPVSLNDWHVREEQDEQSPVTADSNF